MTERTTAEQLAEWKQAAADLLQRAAEIGPDAEAMATPARIIVTLCAEVDQLDADLDLTQQERNGILAEFLLLRFDAHTARVRAFKAECAADLMVQEVEQLRVEVESVKAAAEVAIDAWAEWVENEYSGTNYYEKEWAKIDATRAKVTPRQSGR